MPRVKSGNVKINLLVQPKVMKGLRNLATRRGTTYSELIRIACRSYLEQELRAEISKGLVKEGGASTAKNTVATQ